MKHQLIHIFKVKIRSDEKQANGVSSMMDLGHFFCQECKECKERKMWIENGASEGIVHDAMFTGPPGELQCKRCKISIYQTHVPSQNGILWVDESLFHNLPNVDAPVILG